jgi:hypothetical protein
MAIFSRSSAFQRETSLAAQRPVHAAFAWLHRNPKTFEDASSPQVFRLFWQPDRALLQNQPPRREDCFRTP